MLTQIVRLASATVKSGPRAVVLTRRAKERGAAQKTREFAALLSLVRDRDLSVIVEIGTLSGGTLWAWCQIARPDALIVSIDLPGGRFGGGYDVSTARTLRGYARADQRVVLIRGDSHLESTRIELGDVLDGRRVDFLFIDGDHTYAGVKLDFETYSPLVRQGGMIAFHDILPHSDPECEVDRLWATLRTGRKHVEFLDPQDVRDRGQWGGIGVIFGDARPGIDHASVG